jgi:hypothetical protein
MQQIPPAVVMQEFPEDPRAKPARIGGGMLTDQGREDIRLFPSQRSGYSTVKGIPPITVPFSSTMSTRHWPVQPGRIFLLLNVRQSEDRTGSLTSAMGLSP